jgi:2-amino-4-hydroxy-6-hydroxymethyldihydropteridine diphosphokinase
MAEIVLLGMGSNLGDREAHLGAAVDALAATPGFEVLTVSSLFETAAWGGRAGQRPYFNAALLGLASAIEPMRLLERLQEIESARGRERAERNGPRTLDLDILLFGDRVISEPRLEVPHPRMAERAFVLAPAAEIAGRLVQPELNRDLAALFAALGGDGVMGLARGRGWWNRRSGAPQRELEAELRRPTRGPGPRGREARG